MSVRPELRNPAIDAVLSTAATVLGTEVVFIGGLDDTSFWFDRVLGDWPGVREGVSCERADALCHVMVTNGQPVTVDAANDPVYSAAALGLKLGVRSYVGVPIRRPDGGLVGTLCGIDRGAVPVTDAVVGVLCELATIVGSLVAAQGADLVTATSVDGAAARGTAAAAAQAGSAPATVIWRTPHGWAVGPDGQVEDGLTTAMVLADLLQADLQPGSRPPRPPEASDELTQLRTAVAQLEHALAARVTVEQAIGVLAERFALPPREAFDRLRRVARRSGRRVHDLSVDVVRSAEVHGNALPPELRTNRH